jgi:hypothetical protein
MRHTTIHYFVEFSSPAETPMNGLSLQVQGLTKPPAFAFVLTALLHAPINWLLIYGFDFGYRGAAVATSFNQLLTPVVLLAVVRGKCGSRIGRALLPVGSLNPSSAALSSLGADDDDYDAGGAAAADDGAGAGAGGKEEDPSAVYLRCWSGWNPAALEASCHYPWPVSVPLAL